MTDHLLFPRCLQSELVVLLGCLAPRVVRFGTAAVGFVHGAPHSDRVDARIEPVDGGNNRRTGI